MKITILTDKANNRLQILTPIAILTDLDGDMLKKAVQANFHFALDIKFCVSDEFMWFTFIHSVEGIV